MCLAVPGKVTEIYNANDLILGKVNFAGIQKEVCLEWVPEVQIGDYVIVHVGFAISVMDETEALETLKMLDDINNTTPG